MALSDVSREAIARIHLYSDLQIITTQPPLLYSDSITALLLTDDASSSSEIWKKTMKMSNNWTHK